MELIHNNYLRGSGHGKTWQVAIDPPTRPVKSYYEETVTALEMVWANRQGPLQLCYSGGLDSEYVLAVLLEIGMTAKVIIMRTEYNHPETDYAFKFCSARNITPKIIELNFDRFVESGQLLATAESIESAGVHIPTNMWLASQLDGTVITGNDPPHMKPIDGVWHLDEEEYIHTQLRYFKQNGLQGTPFLLSYTPELMLSFLTDPTMVALANNQIPGKLGTNSSKVHVFNNNGGRFVLEQRTKLHGYELVEQSPIWNHPDIRLVESWKTQWYGSSDHQYHEVVETLSSGKTSIK